MQVTRQQKTPQKPPQKPEQAANQETGKNGESKSKTIVETGAKSTTASGGVETSVNPKTETVTVSREPSSEKTPSAADSKKGSKSSKPKKSRSRLAANFGAPVE